MARYYKVGTPAYTGRYRFGVYAVRVVGTTGRVALVQANNGNWHVVVGNIAAARKAKNILRGFGLWHVAQSFANAPRGTYPLA